MWHHKYGPQSLERRAKLAREQADSLRRLADEKERELLDVIKRYDAADAKASDLEADLAQHAIDALSVSQPLAPLDLLPPNGNGIPDAPIEQPRAPRAPVPHDEHALTDVDGKPASNPPTDEGDATSNEPTSVLPAETDDRTGAEPQIGVESEAGGGARDTTSSDVPPTRPARARRLHGA